MQLHDDKLGKLLTQLTKFQDRRKVTRRELEKLGVSLAHCLKVIRGGRTFSRHIYDMLGKVRKPFFKIRLSRGFQEYVSWWINLAQGFNGKTKILGKFANLQGV